MMTCVTVKSSRVQSKTGRTCHTFHARCEWAANKESKPEMEAQTGKSRDSRSVAAPRVQPSCKEQVKKDRGEASLMIRLASRPCTWCRRGTVTSVKSDSKD